MNSKGDIVRVDRVDGNSVILEDGERVSLNKILDNNAFQEINESSNSYTESDPFDLMNKAKNGFYSNIADQLTNAVRNTNTSNVNYDSGPSFKVLDSVVERHKSTSNDSILVENSDSNIQDLKTKMIEDQKRLNDRIQNQGQKLSQWLDTEATYDPNVTIDKDRDSTIKVFDESNRPVQVTETRENPAHQMFRSLKRSQLLEIDVTISEMLPKKEFIQMWEESYDVSIIEYLADEFVNKYSKNPLLLKGIIMERIKEYAYGNVSVPKVEEKIKKPTVKRTNNKKTNSK